MSATGTIRLVGKWMAFFGWSDYGNPGSVKRDAQGQIIARHGDRTWVADFEEVCASVERQAIRAEIERREREGVRSGASEGGESHD